MKNAQVRIHLVIDGKHSDTWVAVSAPITQIWREGGPDANVARAVGEIAAMFIEMAVHDQEALNRAIL